MRIAGIQNCSFVDGEGCRYVIFLQGCNRKCKGCHNPNTWDINGGYEVSTDTLARWISDCHWIDGVTLSGGEPFLQEQECVDLINKLKPEIDIWAYTGFKYEDIKDTKLASMIDVIVDGAYEEENRVYGRMYGSSNQRIIKVRREK